MELLAINDVGHDDLDLDAHLSGNRGACIFGTALLAKGPGEGVVGTSGIPPGSPSCVRSASKPARVCGERRPRLGNGDSQDWGAHPLCSPSPGLWRALLVALVGAVC